MNYSADVELLEQSNDSQIVVPLDFLPDDIPYGASAVYEPHTDTITIEFNYGSTSEALYTLTHKHGMWSLSVGKVSNRPHRLIIFNFAKPNSKYKLLNLYKEISSEVANSTSSSSRRMQTNIRLLKILLKGSIEIFYSKAKEQPQ